MQLIKTAIRIEKGENTANFQSRKYDKQGKKSSCISEEM